MSTQSRQVIYMCGAALCLSGGAGAASAQNTKPLTITAGAELRHDNNVARASEARAAARGVARDDIIISPSLDIDLVKPLGRHQVAVNGTVSYDFYRRNSFLNRDRIGITASAIVRPGGCSVTVEPGFSRRQSDLGEIAIPVAGGQDSVRNVQTTQTYAGSVECGNKVGFRPVAAVERTIANNSNSARRFSDNRRTSYSAGVGYARPTFGKLQLLLAQENVDYPNRPLPGGSQDGYQTRSAGVRFEREIGANLRLIGQANYLSLRPERAGVPGFKGITYDVGAVLTLADRLKLAANLSRAAQPALQADAAYRIQRVWDVSADFAVSSLLSLSANASFGERSYAGEQPTFGPLLGDDRRNSYSVGVNYAFSDRLTLSADIRYENRDSLSAFYDYDSLSETISIKLVY